MQHSMHPFSAAVSADLSICPAITTPDKQVPAVRSFAQSLVDLWQVLENWANRRRQRYALMELDDHLLKDIGLTRAQAVNEYHKPFWRP